MPNFLPPKTGGYQTQNSQPSSPRLNLQSGGGGGGGGGGYGSFNIPKPQPKQPERTWGEFAGDFVSNLNPLKFAEKAMIPAAKEMVAKPIINPVMTATVGPFAAGVRGVDKIDEPFNVPFIGNINPASKTPQELVGQAAEFGASALPIAKPFASAAAGAGYGAVGSVGRELQNPEATQDSIMSAALFGGGTGALFSPQVTKGATNFFKNRSSKLFDKVVPQTSNQEEKLLQTGLDVGKEMQDRNIWGTTKQIKKQAEDLYKGGLRSKNIILDQADQMGLSVPKKQVQETIRSNILKEVKPKPGTKTAYNNLVDRIIDEVGDTNDFTVRQLDDLRADLGSMARSAYGMEGPQSKEIYKAAEKAMRDLSADIAPIGRNMTLPQIRQDIRVGKKIFKEMKKQLKTPRKFFRGGDVFTTTPGAFVGGLAGGPGGAVIGGVGSKLAKEVGGTNLYRSGMGQLYNRLGNLPLPTQSIGIPQNFMRGLVYNNNQSSLNQP